jgi:hypothetical protein
MTDALLAEIISLKASAWEELDYSVLSFVMIYYLLHQPLPATLQINDKVIK